MTSELAEKECTPCEKERPALKGDAIRRLSRKLGKGWKVVDEHHLEKEYAFEDFREALDFTNQVGEIAEKENHHPDIYLAWGKVRLNIWTHNIDGLSENDFILAAKADSVR
jgi:4a-hydroxytetrahydrobiopterin dehydratase